MLRCSSPLLILLAILLSLTGCSRMDLAYRNLDVIIPWTLNDYLTMNAGQKSWFKDRLEQQLAWHCTTQLPGYLDWLARLQQMAGTRQVSDADLQARTEEARQAVTDIARQITPTAVELLRGLDDQQVADMNKALANDLRKRQDKYLKPPLETQVRERAQRLTKRVQAWMGPLSASQQNRIVAWSTALGEQNRQQIDNRAHWQALFMSAMRDRQSPGFAQKIQQLLADRESLWTPEHRQAQARTETETRSLIIDLMSESTPRQREVLTQKIDQVRSNFQALKCLQGAGT